MTALSFLVELSSGVAKAIVGISALLGIGVGNQIWRAAKSDRAAERARAHVSVP